MATSLLATKVRIPPRTHHEVRRDRLIDALEHGIPNYELATISAPAGYGKTTLLAQWANASQLPVAWLSVSEDDNDPERFLRYLLAAWERVHPGVRESPVGILLGSMMPDDDAVLSAFINVASDIPGHTVFVLDDYHLIEDAAIHQALTFLLDHLPPTFHFVLAVRGEPPLPLARYRARHELLEFRADTLHFRTEETEEFLNRLMGLDLAHDEIVPLQTQMEGWIAGLQLAALTLQRNREVSNGLVVTGRHRFITDYLNEDVLAHLSVDLQRFLLRTSILDRLCGDVCDAVTGNDDGQAMLETLERENLFLVPLDDRREWYRYHRLFADFLQEELNRRHPGEVARLHRRAARWFLTHEMPEQAFRHAVTGEDLDLTIQISERYAFIKLHGGQFRILTGWLDSLPAEWYAAYPAFGLLRAGLLAFSGDFEGCIRCIDEVGQRVDAADTDDSRWQMARVTAIRCFVACMHNDLERAEALAAQALRDLPDEDLGFRADTYHALGDTYRQNGYWEKARQHYLKVLDFTHDPAFLLQAVHVFGALADLELRQGRLQNASGYWRKALAASQEPENWGRIPLPVISWVYTRMGEILYEWNELPEAWDYLSRGLQRAELSGDVRTMAAGYLIAGRMKLTAGSVEAAVDYLEQARPLMEEAQYPEWFSRFERLQLELWLTRGRLRAAVHWADEMLRDGSLLEQPEPDVAQLAVARVLIVKGDLQSVKRSMGLLRPLLAAAEADGRMGIHIETLALHALAQWRQGEPAGAMTSLEHALRLAEPEGYVRLFADLGLPMARLLQETRSREVMPDYVRTLLAACGADVASPVTAGDVLTEPLTGREREILELLAAGLTNREIAEKLIVSPQTVKKHTGNIYGKLGVRGRTAAAARARDLNLLE